MEPKFYVLVAHGLNLNPQKMKSFFPLIESLGGKAELIQFAGHSHTKLKEYNTVQKDQWLENINDKFQDYLKNYSSIPLYYLGFSLGALTCTAYLQNNAEFQHYLKKQIFLAPGIEPHGIYEKIYRVTGSPNIWAPSLNRYNVHKINSIRVYGEIFKLIKDLKNKSLSPINIPTLVFLNPKDELVSFDKTQKFIIQNNLSNWQVTKIIPKRKPLQFLPQHLMIDELSAGSEAWENMQWEIKEFLRN